MEKIYNLVEFFSGIGSQAKALKNLGVNVRLQGTSEWDVHAIAAYDVIHNSPDIPSEIQNMSKRELLAILEKYTFSNSGKAPLDFSSLRTYSEDPNHFDISFIHKQKGTVAETILATRFLCSTKKIRLQAFALFCQGCFRISFQSTVSVRCALEQLYKKSAK